jgi:FecR protein
MNASNRPGPLRALRLGLDPVLDPAREAARRERIVGRIHALQQTLPLEQTPTKRERVSLISRLRVGVWATRNRAALLAAGVMLGCVVAFVGWPRTSGQLAGLELQAGELTVLSASGQRLLRDAQRFEVSNGGMLQTAERSANVTLPSRANAALDPASVVAFERVGSEQAPAERWGERLQLRRGKVALKVPHLAPRQYLAVETSDTVVEVHGTAFSVQVDPASAGEATPTTRVSVLEGVVSVTHHGARTLLTAGQSWVTPSQPTVASDVTPDVTEPAPSAPLKNTEAPAIHPPAQDLAEQNRLFAAAQRARISGQTSGALQSFEVLMRRFPRSELAQNARVEHFRLLKASGRRAEASRSAASYLAAYPHGFARSEAQALVAQ